MIAFHFPPLAGSSGIQRTLRFVQQLPAHGWEPVVLSVTPRAYQQTRDDLLDDIPTGIRVVRAPGLDTARHLALKGKYPGFLARPDRWMSWWPGAVLSGLRLIQELKPAAIWSTFPIATAHQIGSTLCSLSRLPWIADFRDPMAQAGYPSDPKLWRSYQRVEASAISKARFSVCTTPSAARTYRARYPAHADDIVVIENGYDEASFADCVPQGPLIPNKVVLLHSGIVYPSERDPSELLRALRMLVDSGTIEATNFCVRFRAPIATELIETLARRYGVRDLIEILPAVDYRIALSEMLSADGLLLLQAANCNEQIPAKLYEYLRARRPIIALTDTHGDTAEVLRRAGIEPLAPLDQAPQIAAALGLFLRQRVTQAVLLPSEHAIAGAARTSRTRELAALLERAVGALA